MHWMKRIRCWWRGHERISGICLQCSHLRPISGGQDEVFGAFGEAAPEITGAIGGGGASYDFPSLPEPSSFSRFASSLGEGAGKIASSLGKEITDSPLRALTSALGIGSAALGISSQLGAQKQLARQTKTIERGQKTAEQAAAPAVAFGQTTLESAAKGNLTPALQAQIDQWVAQKKADARARMASMGLGNSTQLNQLDQLIDQQAQAMKGQMLAQQEETGLAGLQTGVSAGTGVMGVAQRQQEQLTDLIQRANQAIGSLGGSAS